MMHKTLRIKHVTGRMLVDSDQVSGGPEVSELPGATGWLVSLAGVNEAVAETVRQHLEELNIFYFEQDRPDGPLRKWWLYDRDIPKLTYDRQGERLTLNVDSRVAYSNESVAAPDTPR